MSTWNSQLEQWLRLSCVAEVSAAKPGNVSPQKQFVDVSASDFLISADVIAPIVSRVNATASVNPTGVGETIFLAVQATHASVHSNTNLGIILLLTPLAAVPADCSLVDGIERVLDSLTIEDAVFVYRAINLASPGGLGTASDQDVAKPPSMDLRSCMRLAADHDLIAAQYANAFKDVLGSGLIWLRQTREWSSHYDCRLGWLALSLMAEFGDSLILRKCGEVMFLETSRKARGVLDAGWPFTAGSQNVYNDLDRFLRADGNRRNPGTTADIIAAVLFAAFREGLCASSDDGTQLEFHERH